MRKLFRCLVLSASLLGLGLAVVSESAAQVPFRKRPFAQKNLQKPTDTTPSPDADPLTAPLLSRDLVIKLRFTTQQKPMVDKLQAEYASKLKDIRDQAMKDAKENGNTLDVGKAGKGAKGAQKGGKGAGKTAGKSSGNTRGLSDAADLRNEYEGKVEELLTDAQKKIWEDIKVKQGEAALAGAKNSSGDTKPAKKK
jgi:hypothetical protein